MNSKISGSNVLELLALAAGVVPVPAVESLLPLIKARAVSVAVNLGIFEVLKECPLTARDLGQRCGVSPEGTGFLLRTLIWAGYLEPCGTDQFRLTKLSRSSMLISSPRSQVGFVTWNSHATAALLGQLEDCLRQGRGLDFHHTMADPALWASYQRAMMEGARFAAPTLARLVPVKKGARKLLDVAGSHGLLGASICRRHPPMRSTVLDLPSAVGHARVLAGELKINDVVEHRPGNLLIDSFGDENDVILLSNILHNLDPAAIPDVLTRAAASASRGATIAIWEVETPDRSARPNHGDAFALFCWTTSTSGCFTAKQYSEWLRQAGLGDITRKHPKSNPGQVLVWGRTSAR